MRMGTKRTPGLVVQPNSLEVPAGAVERLENVVHTQDNVYIKERGFKNLYTNASGVNYYGLYEFGDYIHAIANNTVTVYDKNGALVSGPTTGSPQFEVDGTLRPSAISFTYAPFNTKVNDSVFFCTPDGVRVARTANSAVTNRPGLEPPVLAFKTPLNQRNLRRCSWVQIAGTTIEVTLSTVAPDIRFTLTTNLTIANAYGTAGSIQESLNGDFITATSQNYAAGVTTFRFTASGTPTEASGTLYVGVGFTEGYFGDKRAYGVNDLALVPTSGYYTPVSGSTAIVPGDCPADRAVSYKAVLRRVTAFGELESEPSQPIYGFNSLAVMNWSSTGTTTITVNDPTAAFSGFSEHNYARNIPSTGKVASMFNGATQYPQGEGTRRFTLATKDTMTFTADSAVPAGGGTLLMQVDRFSLFEVILPNDAIEGDFIDLYFSQSEVDLSDNPTAVPNGDYYLAKSIPLKATDITNKRINPDLSGGIFQKGIPLYTNPSDGDRTRQPNSLPPGANCIESWKGSLFFGGCYRRYELVLTHIGSQILGNGTFFITSLVGSESFTFKYYDAPATGAIIKTRIQFLCAEINRNSSTYVAYYDNNAANTPGTIIIRSRIPNLPFSVTASTTAIRASFEPTLDLVYAPSGIPASIEEVKNRIYWSKPNQPEAVPFYIDVGLADKFILNIKKLRDSLIVIKEDGVFSLYGDPGSGVMQVRELDTTIHGISATGVCVLGNRVFAKTDQGVVAITESSLSLVSRNQIEPLVKVSDENFTQDTVMYGQEEDRMLYMCTAKSPVDATKIVYAYNFLTQTWSELSETFVWGIVLDVNSAVTSGVLNNNRVTINLTNQMIRLERKDNLLTDWSSNDVAETVSALANDNRDVTFGGDVYSVGSVVRWTNSGVDYLYRIVSVSGTVHTLDIPFGGAVSASVRVFTPIRSVIRTAPLDGGDSSVVKQFTKLILNMRYDALSACTLDFRNDWFEYGDTISWEKTTERRGWGAQQWGRFPWGQATADALQYLTKPSQIVQTEIPRPLQKSTFIQAEITHEVACEGIFIQQMSFETRPSSDKAAR